MTAVLSSSWHECGTLAGLLDHLDANCRRVRRPDVLGSLRVLFTVVHASGYAPLLLYILLYGIDAYLLGQLGRTPADFAISTGVGLFVPKPTRDALHHHSYSG
jgi:hypothetical protein